MGEEVRKCRVEASRERQKSRERESLGILLYHIVFLAVYAS